MDTTALNSDRVRPFTVTGGRTEGRHHLLLETLISVRERDTDFEKTLMPEAQKIYALACAAPISVAELSTSTAISLGVVRILVGDLAASERVVVHPNGLTYRRDRSTLLKVLEGLRNLGEDQPHAV